MSEGVGVNILPIPVEEMSNDVLLNEMIIWIRIGRNEEGLKGEEKKYFRAVCDEVKKRGLLNPQKEVAYGM
jgi:hypothetical protein